MDYIIFIIAIVLAPVLIKMLDRGYIQGKKSEFGKDIKSFLVDTE